MIKFNILEYGQTGEKVFFNKQIFKFSLAECTCHHHSKHLQKNNKTPAETDKELKTITQWSLALAIIVKYLFVFLSCKVLKFLIIVQSFFNTTGCRKTGLYHLMNTESIFLHYRPSLHIKKHSCSIVLAKSQWWRISISQGVWEDPTAQQ
jgi:hypothetical protein